jgi:hypothetical protein
MSVEDIPEGVPRLQGSRVSRVGIDAGIGGGFRHVRGRVLQRYESHYVRRGASLLLVLYLAWVASPALHQLHLGGEAGPCQSCPAEDPGWLVLSHPPDQPCSDPDHHHHSRPAHEADHCLSCRLGSAAVAGLPFIEMAIRPGPVAGSAPPPRIVGPVSPALLTVSPRAPPRLPRA